MHTCMFRRASRDLELALLSCTVSYVGRDEVGDLVGWGRLLMVVVGGKYG